MLTHRRLSIGSATVPVRSTQVAPDAAHKPMAPGALTSVVGARDPGALQATTMRAPALATRIDCLGVNVERITEPVLSSS
jgi:hypothetical protein